MIFSGITNTVYITIFFFFFFLFLRKSPKSSDIYKLDQSSLLPTTYFCNFQNTKIFFWIHRQITPQKYLSLIASQPENHFNDWSPFRRMHNPLEASVTSHEINYFGKLGLYIVMLLSEIAFSCVCKLRWRSSHICKNVISYACNEIVNIISYDS